MTASTPALLLTDDPDLVAHVQRLAAAAGAELSVAADPTGARIGWVTAPVVLVGPDLLPALADTRPLRRDQVHVVVLGASSDSCFRAALDIGAESVVELPHGEPWLVETLADTADGASVRANVVGVVGGCGGAGATMFATALATAAAQDVDPASGVHPAMLVDADPLGPGIERVAGLEDVEGTRWDALLQSAGRLGSRSLRKALPAREGLSVLGWGPGRRAALAPGVVREVLSAGARGSGLVVVDLPRYPDPAAAEILQRCDHVVVVTTLELAGVASAARVVAEVLPDAGPTWLVARGPATALDPAEVSSLLGVPLAAAMTDQRRLAESVELGLGPLSSRRGPLARAAREVLEVLRTPAGAEVAA
ncbi:MAG TPA: septum site-determining protein Ssd [Nocardioidaceae bacterium]|nr:septum site-determining protein Ssd [Nocardioidaceae bacterium]